MADTQQQPIRVRFAPSPTGYLHIGGLRTALYNYLFARSQGGTFVLRIEDTDQQRYVEGAERDIIEALEWAGLEYDEGPPHGGPYTPYHQSERKDIYQRHVQLLLDAGHAYYAFDTPEELDAMRTRLQAAGNPAPKYDVVTRTEMSNGLTLSESEVQHRLDAGTPYVVRLRVPEAETVQFEDVVRGHISFGSEELDDQVLLKSDGLPTYHLANVVDDHLMGITHVIRGEEWLPSTPKHILLYQFFDWEPPQMAHLPLILSPNGGKLSKRNADKMGIPVSVSQYQKAGYEPEALINFLAFLGWNPGTEQERFTLTGLSKAFSLERVGSAGVQFNLDKLNWYNQQFIHDLDRQQLLQRARPHLKNHGFSPEDAYLSEVVALLQDRLGFIEEVATTYSYFFADPESYDEGGIKKRWKADSATLLTEYANRLEATENFTADEAEAVLREIAEAHGAGAGRIIHPARLAVSGVSFGPSLFHMMEVLGQNTCVRRIKAAVTALK